MHLRAAVFDRHRTGDIDRLGQTPFVPFVQVFLHAFLVLDTLVGVVDEGAQSPFLLFVHGVTIDLVHFLANDAGGVLDHVDEGRRRAVQVAHEMLRAFGQREDRMQVDELRNDALRVGKFLA